MYMSYNLRMNTLTLPEHTTYQFPYTIGSDDGFAIGGVFDDPYPELIGRTLESQSKNRLGRWSEW